MFHGNGFFQSAVKVGSGNLIGQAVAIITTPILSHIYSDVAYGDHAIIVSTAAIIINISTLGLNSAIMKPEEDDESRRIITTAFYLNAFISTAVALACLALHRVFRLVNVSGSYFVALILMWLYLILYTAQSQIMIYTNRKGCYNRLFFNPIIGAAGNIFLAIPLGLAGFGYEGFLITSIVSALVQIIHMTWKDNPIYRGYRLSDFLNVLKNYKKYILFQYPSDFLMDIGTEYPTQFLGRSFSSGELGSYSICLNVLKYPLRLIAAPISTVYFRTATEYHRQGKNLADFTYKMISRILLWSLLPVAACCIFSERIFAFVLGATWATAGTIASIKAVEYVMLFCSNCLSYCRVSIGKQQSNLIYSVIRLAVIVVFSTSGYALFGNLMGTIAMVTVGNTLMNIFNMAMNFFYLDKRLLPKYLVLAFSYTGLIAAVVFVKFF